MGVERSSSWPFSGPSLGQWSWRLGFGLAWALAIIMGGAVAGGLLDVLALAWPTMSDYLRYALVGLIAGLVSGTFQAVKLRGILPAPWKWVIATSVGTLLISEIVLLTVVEDAFSAWYMELRRNVHLESMAQVEWGLAAGVAVLMQAVLLRGRVRLLGIWAIVTLLGWLAGITWIVNAVMESVAEIILPTDQGVAMWSHAQIFAAGSAMGGGIASAALAALLLRPEGNRVVE